MRAQVWWSQGNPSTGQVKVGGSGIQGHPLSAAEQIQVQPGL